MTDHLIGAKGAETLKGLRPCPFCGEQPEPLSPLKGYEQNVKNRWRCENSVGECPLAGLTMTRSEWNRRPSPSATRAASIQHAPGGCWRVVDGNGNDLAKFRTKERAIAYHKTLASLPVDALSRPSPTEGDREALIADLRAPSHKQDSKWHTAKATYATVPRELLDAAADALSRTPGLGFTPTHRHVKRGSDYQVIGTAALQIEPSRRLPDMAQVMVYRDAEGKLWVRPTAEFEDGRFEALAQTTPPASGKCPTCGRAAAFSDIPCSDCPDPPASGAAQGAFDYDMLTAIAEQIGEIPPSMYSGRQCSEMVLHLREMLSAPPPGVVEALKDVTFQLERVLNDLGLYHDDAAEIVLYRAKDALAALAPAPQPEPEGDR